MSLFNELMNFASAGMQSLPFMALAVLGYLGARNSSLKPLAIAWLAILLMGFALFAFSLSLLGAVDLNAFRTGTGAGAPTLLPAAQRIVIFCLVGITIGLLVGVLRHAHCQIWCAWSDCCPSSWRKS